ncbi:MAG: LemA family protein [Pseudomonadota bacterium]
MRAIITKVLAIVLMCLLLLTSVLMGEWGFGNILNLRVLERLPLTAIGTSIDGEAQFKGRLSAFNEATLRAPKTGQTSLYYRYTIEKEERDSDGNKSWRTIHDEQKAVDFVIDDRSGEALVRAAVSQGEIDWSVRQRFQNVERDRRYTEWRIEPGDTITLFGWYTTGTVKEIDFRTEGQYLPIITHFGDEDRRSGFGLVAVFLLGASLAAMVFACLGLMYMLRVHRTLVFLLSISVSTTLLLVHYGLRSMEEDVSNGFERVTSVMERTEAANRKELTGKGLLFTWQSSPSLRALGVDPVTAQRLEDRRIAAWLTRERYFNQISRFPESWMASASDADQIPVIALPSGREEEAIATAETFKSTRLSQAWWVSALNYVALILPALLAWGAFRLIKTKRLQENIPTSKTAGVVYGMSEVTGKLVATDPDNTLTGPLSTLPCTWYHYVIQERRQAGKNENWVTVHTETKKQPFYCEDDEGQIRIFPGQAEVVTTHSSSKRQGDRRYSEKRLMPGDELYVLGKAKPDKTVGNELVLSHEKGSPFIVANVPEADIMFKKAIGGFSMLAVGISLLFMIVIFLGGIEGQFSSLDFLKASLIAPIFLFFMMFMLMYNDLVFLYQRCERNWANIQVSLKKRATLLPQLEMVVKQYLSHEADLQTRFAELRTKQQATGNAEDIDTYLAQEHDSISQLNARLEAYPDLEGSAVVSDMGRRLIKLENEVALIRAGFNDAVTTYQTRCQTFPDNLMASLFKFKSLTLLSFDKAAHAIPKIKMTREEPASDPG